MPGIAIWLAIIIVLTGLSRAVLADCGPAPLGPPCAQGGIASLASAEPLPGLGAGNPINLATGNKYQHEVDLPANPHAPGLEIVRHYNSMDPRASALGQGWSLSYDTRLYRVKQGWQIVQADGQRIDFPDNGTRHSKTLQTTPAGEARASQGHLVHHASHHEWLWPTGTRLHFDSGGYLTALHRPDGTHLELARETEPGPLRGLLRSVRNQAGQSLAFQYAFIGDQVRLTAIDTPLGSFTYAHDTEVAPGPLRLGHVTRPDGMQRQYLYEESLQAGHAHALTGIVITTAGRHHSQRLNTWEYDDQGRAIRSVRGAPDSDDDEVRLDYLQPASTQQEGLTAVRTARGEITTFRIAVHAGRYRLTRVEGSGCPGCPQPGTHAHYDRSGHLQHINGTTLERDGQGHLRRLQPAHPGWPGLQLHYDSRGLRSRWSSTTTGTETIVFDDQALPVARILANGDRMDITYDPQQRPVRIVEQHDSQTATTRLDWHGNRLVRIAHPQETEERHYDHHGRLAQRRVQRPASSARGALSYTEYFEYNKQGRVHRHHLPEGGQLVYHWGAGQTLLAIDWHNPQGQRHTVLASDVDQPGYRYGNGVALSAQTDALGRLHTLTVSHGKKPVWSQHLRYDARHRIHSSAIADSRQETLVTHYAYNDAGQLIGTETAGSGPRWLAWHSDGSLAAQRHHSLTQRAQVQRDSSGLARQFDGFTLAYNASRRLSHVSRQGRTLVRYVHNAFGYRISRHGPAQAHTDYLYLDNQVVAEAVAGAPTVVSRRYIYAHHVPVGLIDYSHAHPQGQLFAVHADALGAPRLITDDQGAIRWQADYTALGQARRIAGDMNLDLRLPGQLEDPVTGWHDNLLRTYLPQWGHYLEPDPLGPVPGNQALGYARQQPHRHSDPTGLLLFAFDGTRQSAATQSNVWKMLRYYEDGPAYYVEGPGNTETLDWDALTAHQAGRIIETQWRRLLQELARPEAAQQITAIDILGFSRGAALARHFGNLIEQHVSQGLFRIDDPLHGQVSVCVDLRFMGLFDTVAQFGVGGIQNRYYDLSIAPAWEWVAHAVALHERRWLFPLTAASDTTTPNVVEAPFIGAHSDIGGGILPELQGQPGGRGDLSVVALQWMLWQAQAASVPWRSPEGDDLRVDWPIVHDSRAVWLRTVQNGDRSVQRPDARPWLNYQDDHPRLGRTTRASADALIEREPGWPATPGTESGQVDMDGYRQWLHDQLGWDMHAV